MALGCVLPQIMAVAVAFEQLDTACTIHDQIRSHGNAPISTDLMIKAACVHERVDLLCRALQWVRRWCSSVLFSHACRGHVWWCGVVWCGVLVVCPQADAATFAERHLRRLRMQLLWSNNPLNDDQLSHTNMSQPWWGLLTTPLLNDTVEELLDHRFGLRVRRHAREVQRLPRALRLRGVRRGRLRARGARAIRQRTRRRTKGSAPRNS